MLNRCSSSEGIRQSAPKGSDVMLMAAKINLDIAEIEILFGVGQKKGKAVGKAVRVCRNQSMKRCQLDQGGDYTKAQMVRKSPLITLLEFNRANNIGRRMFLYHALLLTPFYSDDLQPLCLHDLSLLTPTSEMLSGALMTRSSTLTI
jgi:hypothetical protein